MLSFTDDAMMSRKAIALHADNFRSADIEHRHIAPSDFGLDEINHFGFFRPAIGAAMWRPTLDWLDDAMKHTMVDDKRQPTAGGHHEPGQQRSPYRARRAGHRRVDQSAAPPQCG
jgi:hypothetical protein